MVYQWTVVSTGGTLYPAYRGFVLVKRAESWGNPPVMYPYYVVRRKEAIDEPLSKRERRFRGWWADVEVRAGAYIDRLIQRQEKENAQ